MRGHSASQTRVNALLTRASIFLRRGWIASELGYSRVPHHWVPQVG